MLFGIASPFRRGSVFFTLVLLCVYNIIGAAKKLCSNVFKLSQLVKNIDVKRVDIGE